jgi:uncharacterized Ntn-hydrolase superfamily protein
MNRPMHTYSFVARDPETGEMGVAVQSHWFSVGALCPWAEAGVGAIATQSFVNVSFGPRGLELLRAGKRAGEVVEALIEADEGREVRQLAVLDAQGSVAVHTGSGCVPAAGHVVGAGYSSQANLMRRTRRAAARWRSGWWRRWKGHRARAVTSAASSRPR